MKESIVIRTFERYTEGDASYKDNIKINWGSWKEALFSPQIGYIYIYIYIYMHTICELIAFIDTYKPHS